MFSNYRRKLLNATQANYINLLITGSAVAVSGYLGYAKSFSPCVFCTAIRLLLVLSMGLSLGSIIIPAHRRRIYPVQVSSNVIGLLLSLRQVYFEHTVSRFKSCARYSSNAFQAVFNWLYAGAPACQKTASIGYFSLAGWAYIIFVILSLLALQTYLKKPENFKRFYR